MADTEQKRPMPNESYDWDAARERMREQADRGFPPAWIPEGPGSELIAVLKSVKPSVRTAYGPVPVLELEEPATHTEWSLWLMHAVLRRSVWRLRPIAGEVLYIRYEGRVKPEGAGPPYESYTVLADRPDVGDEVDWEAIARRYDPDALEEREPEITPGPEPEPAFDPRDPADDDIPF